jgi:hypothetical protein
MGLDPNHQRTRRHRRGRLLVDYIESFGGLAWLGHCSLGSTGRIAPTVGTGPPGNILVTVDTNTINIDPGEYGGPTRIAIQGLDGFGSDPFEDQRTLNTRSLSALQGLS